MFSASACSERRNAWSGSSRRASLCAMSCSAAGAERCGTAAHGRVHRLAQPDRQQAAGREAARERVEAVRARGRRLGHPRHEREARPAVEAGHHHLAVGACRRRLQAASSWRPVRLPRIAFTRCFASKPGRSARRRSCTLSRYWSAVATPRVRRLGHDVRAHHRGAGSRA